jgi:DNA polymerase-1
MIYLVTKQQSLWASNRYKVISAEEALELLAPLNVVELDTETMGLDPYTKELLTVQLGCADFQVVIDCTSVDIHLFKEYMENPQRIFLGWNIKFDLKFLYHQRIIPMRVYDGYLAEKLLWLGYPAGMHEMSLKAASINYLGVDMDKSVRGKIIQTGLTEDVIVYAAGDVSYLGRIRDKQLIELEKKGLLKAIDFENEFVKCLAYIEYCGAKLDIDKWKIKMATDLNNLERYEAELNDWVERYCTEYGDKGYTINQVIHIDKWYKSEDVLKEERAKLPLNAVRAPEFDSTGASHDSEAYVIKQTGNYCSVNMQGDLFSGFDTKPRCHINWTSSQQVIPLFEELGLNLRVLDKKTKHYKKSVDIKVVEPQASKSPLIPIYIKYKKAAIIVNTFGQKFLNLINPVTGRIHANFNQLGTDTGRLSSTEPNLQNLPHDAQTRACFVSDKGNRWISADYSGQESYLMASMANDEAMLEELTNGSGDLHSLTAKMVFQQIPRDMPLKDIKKNFKDLRQEAKGYEFCFNYGGQDSTLIRNYGLDAKRAKEIYKNYMSGFAGLKRYQDFRRVDVMRKGYILLSKITGHKAYIYDYDELKRQMDKQEDPEFWAYYREMKQEDPDCDTVQGVRRLARRKAESEKQSINYPIQATGALCFKLASIKLFNWLLKNGLLFKVKYCIPVHDEINLEAPDEIAQEVADILVKCMVSAGKPFCTRAHLGADVEVGDHWIH